MDDTRDTRSRKWQLTINNPDKLGYSHQRIKEILGSLKSMEYWCMSDEIGTEGTYHTHIYLYCANAIRFSTIKNKFIGAHIEMANGTSQQNRDYIYKEGKWEKDKKKETNLPETHEEYGQIPVERQGQRNDLADLYDMIKSGMTNYEILEICPQYMNNTDKIDRVRQIIREAEYKDTFRNLEITYIWGETNTGKTRSIMEKYGYSSVFRVTDYDHPFDNYKGQDVIIFEEFRSSLKIQDMLNYLDGYPLELPCRYANKIACYTKIYIVTNIPLYMQYEQIQREHIGTWKAFLRRIGIIREYYECGKYKELSVSEYMEKDIDRLGKKEELKAHEQRYFETVFRGTEKSQ